MLTNNYTVRVYSKSFSINVINILIISRQADKIGRLRYDRRLDFPTIYRFLDQLSLVINREKLLIN